MFNLLFCKVAYLCIYHTQVPASWATAYTFQGDFFKRIFCKTEADELNTFFSFSSWTEWKKSLHLP